MMKKARLAFDFITKPYLFQPTVKVNHFSQILTLVQQGKIEVETMFIDKDDTITAYREFAFFDQKIRKSVEELNKNGVKLNILSNGIRAGDPLEVEGIKIVKTKGKKPFNGNQVLQLAEKTQKHKIWVVGDRLMTDIYLANSMGCKSILVSPLETTTIQKHGVAVFILRKIQNSFLKNQ